MRERKRDFESRSRWTTLSCDICSSRTRSIDVYIMGSTIYSMGGKKYSWRLGAELASHRWDLQHGRVEYD